MNLQEYQSTFNENQAVGALFVEHSIKELYPALTPNFYSPQVLSFQGGEDALDGVAIYKTADYYHLISYGMSQLYYNEEAVGQEYSKWGFEFSMRIKPFEGDNGEEPFWAIQLMQNLGRFVYDTQIYFDENQFIPLGGPIREDADTAIVGVIFIKDVELGEINTPHGKVKFLQMVGIDQSTLTDLETDPSPEHIRVVIESISKNNPIFVNQL
ncbi:suppressor of fused domain protein [Vaginella massiliensis]|uniref:suppressor of fused domain protein n=1 Tax=Vaginella massiliensis TaxID=1816680 RepID=UPI0008394E13|nr:suppressor of fused domain protein [Vaginella massiliensis]